MKYTYLLINLLTVIFPIALSFDKRVQFYKSWRFIWPGMAITGIMFLFWDVLFTIKGVWSFNDNYIIGIRLFQLPLEEILFFLTVPFSCIFIYECLNYYVKWQVPQRLSKSISIILMSVSLVLAIAFHNRLYTIVTFTLLYVLLGVLQSWLKSKWLSRFYMAFVVSLIPFYIVNGILTSIPIVLYNNQQNMAFRIGTIPFEDHFYLMALLMMNIAFFEYFRNKKLKAL
ncbi:lycopene cyclase domain-containing protein [Mucilaginibacter jinjuensis]|uniref:Lycopene cyclase domain-containing protein n=1 Tax=Mucilaginibacter jinjuensis TaxID=1176721 RepID=A0ABY7T692_9SPHI|nr:lycopene cyclase domain-containing protein [Mucilaginibacter jinjuensis]WCT11288.1 lycopene cyclase domain-containing protein [Mucilaginibacter jinjuensis]